MIRRFKVDVLNYVVTSNHIHLLVYAGKGSEIANGMQYLQGRIAQIYNKVKNREGAFWSGRYHATLIQSGAHLSECLFYIDYNMLRAGVVSHPSEWNASGHREITGEKRGDLIVNRRMLLNRLGMIGREKDFLKWYLRTIEAKTDAYLERQAYWTEALAVGEEQWVVGIKGSIGKNRLKIVKIAKSDGFKYRQAVPGVSYLELREVLSPYALY